MKKRNIINIIIFCVCIIYINNIKCVKSARDSDVGAVGLVADGIFDKILSRTVGGIYEWAIDPVTNFFGKTKNFFTNLMHSVKESEKYGLKYWNNLEKLFIEYGVPEKTDALEKLKKKWINTFNDKWRNSIILPDKILHIMIEVSLNNYVVYMREAFYNQDTSAKDKLYEFINKDTKEYFEWCWNDLDEKNEK